MADEKNTQPGKKPDKTIKPNFNSNWIWAILLISILLFEVVFSSKSTPKTTKSAIIGMIENHDIKNIVLINNEIAEIYLTDEAAKNTKRPVS